MQKWWSQLFGRLDMELKESIERIQYDINMCNHKQWGSGDKLGDCFACRERQFAISHLETLLKVQEMGGVRKKKSPPNNSIYRKL